MALEEKLLENHAESQIKDYEEHTVDARKALMKFASLGLAIGLAKPLLDSIYIGPIYSELRGNLFVPALMTVNGRQNGFKNHVKNIAAFNIGWIVGYTLDIALGYLAINY